MYLLHTNFMTEGIIRTRANLLGTHYQWLTGVISQVYLVAVSSSTCTWRRPRSVVMCFGWLEKLQK